MQSTIPIRVGSNIETAVHFSDPVSFFMLKTVVEQGQWNRQKIIMHRAVEAVQPWEAKIENKAEGSDISIR